MFKTEKTYSSTALDPLSFISQEVFFERIPQVSATDPPSYDCLFHLKIPLGSSSPSPTNLLPHYIVSFSNDVVIC